MEGSMNHPSRSLLQSLNRAAASQNPTPQETTNLQSTFTTNYDQLIIEAEDEIRNIAAGMTS